jgi:hypothetical protein
VVGWIVTFKEAMRKGDDWSQLWKDGEMNEASMKASLRTATGLGGGRSYKAEVSTRRNLGKPSDVPR